MMLMGNLMNGNQFYSTFFLVLRCFLFECVNDILRMYVYTYIYSYLVERM